MTTMIQTIKTLLLLLSLHLAWCQDLESQLLSLLAPAPALGEPWPSIPGPDLDDRVCIVGAGAAGIHMAISLKKKNYKKVVVFEKSGRIGGKCFDINYRGTPQAQGADFLEANYFNEDSFVPVLKEYGLDDLVRVPPTDIWATNSANDPRSRLTRTQFFLLAASKLTNSTSPQVNIDFFLKTIIRYIKVHKEMFGLYEGDLMQRPTPEVMFRIRGTIQDFLTRENLLGMIPIFQGTQTTAGYGHLDEVGALYGLIWHNPRLVLTYALAALKKDKKPFSLFSLKYGYEHVWKTIAEKEKLDIRFQTDITSIQRKNNGVYLKTWQNFEAKTESCEFLIWTPEVTQLLRTLDKQTKEERRLLASLKTDVYYAHLIDVEGGVRHSPTTAFMTNVLSKEEYAVTWTADTAGLLTPGIKTPEGLAKYNNGTGLRTLYALHAPSKQYKSEAFLKKKMRDHLMEGFNVTNAEFLNTISWPYFPRWSPEEVIEGRHWKVFKMQGQNKIWYAGVSASFESVRSVVSYNNRLLKQMIPQKRYKVFFKSSNHQAPESVYQHREGTSTAINVDNCKYSCTPGGGCKVHYFGPNRRGYNLGSCWPNGGTCGGTPLECQDCDKVITC